VQSCEELLCEGARLSRERLESTDYCCNSTTDSISKVCKVGIWGIKNTNELIVNLLQFLSVELLNYEARWGHCISFSDKYYGNHLLNYGFSLCAHFVFNMFELFKCNIVQFLHFIIEFKMCCDILSLYFECFCSFQNILPKYIYKLYIFIYKVCRILSEFFYGIPLVKILGPPLDIMGSEGLMCPGIHSV
jgi:hypothetical protein